MDIVLHGIMLIGKLQASLAYFLEYLQVCIQRLFPLINPSDSLVPKMYLLCRL